MRPSILLLCPLFALLAGCAGRSMPHVDSAGAVAASSPVATDSDVWRSIATETDQHRIDAIGGTWTAALDALPARLKPRTAADRQLLDPDAARPLPQLPPGGYICRRVRLGGSAKLTRFKPNTCYVGLEGERLSFTTQTGAMMPGGWLYPNGDRNVILIATDRPAGTVSAPAYGGHPARDLVGLVERIGPMRWRLVIPRADELDVWELKPAPGQEISK